MFSVDNISGEEDKDNIGFREFSEFEVVWNDFICGIFDGGGINCSGDRIRAVVIGGFLGFRAKYPRDVLLDCFEGIVVNAFAPKKAANIAFTDKELNIIFLVSVSSNNFVFV